jgi:Flp pilus assembly protein protease CpaA
VKALAEQPAADENATIRRESRSPSVAAWWLLALCSAAVIASGLQLGSGQASHGYFVRTLCIVVCTGAAWVDLTTRRIPNLLTYPAILLGLGLNAALFPALEAAGAETTLVWLGSPGPRQCLLGFGLCAAIGIISFVARGLGGGDVKLLGAVGAFLGLDLVAAVLFNTLLVAAVIGVANWAVNGTLLARAQMAAYNLTALASPRRGRHTSYPFKPTESPFGVALLAGLVLAQFVALHRVLLTMSW